MISILTYYTPSHEHFFLNYFLKSIKDNFVVFSHYGGQISNDGGYYSKGFNETMKNKIIHVRNRLMDLEDGDFVLYSDVDVIFIKPISEYIKKYEEYDIVFQNNHNVYHNGMTGLNAGFFIAKKNKIVIDFLSKVIDDCHKHFDDQETINAIINDFQGLKYSIFDNKIFCVAATNNSQIWNGEPINFLDDIIAFHACWCVGVDNKIKMLELAKQFYQKK